MTNERFDTPVFINEKHETAVDISKTPFFYNDGGRPTYVKTLPSGATPLVPAVTDPHVAIGREHVVSGVLGVKPTPTLWRGDSTRIHCR